MANFKLFLDFPNIKLNRQLFHGTWITGFLKVVSSQFTDSLYSHVLYDRIRMQKIVHMMTEFKLIITNNINNQKK
jgi:hypothetical protein